MTAMRIRIAHNLCLLLATLSLCSCIYDNESVTDDAAQTMQVKFTISMNNISGGSRAGTWGDNDYSTESANYWESAIELTKLQVLVYSTADKYIGKIKNMSYNRRTGSESNIYDIIGSLDIDESLLNNGKLECKFVVLANYDNTIAEQATGADLSAIKDILYSYNATAIADHSAYIPMWGVQSYLDTNTDTQYKALTLKKGSRTDAGDIYMLRAMSKIRIKLSDELAGQYKLSDVKLSSYNTKGYITPKGYDVSNTKSLHYTVDSGTDISYNPYESAVTASVDFQTEKADSSYIVYVPECNTATLESDICVAIKNMSDELIGNFAIRIANYTDGKADDDGIELVRNTIYEYEITKIKEKDEPIYIAYKVMPWIEGGTYNIVYSFETTLSAQTYRIKELSDTDKAIAVTYAASNAGNSPWLTLNVETGYTWTLHIDNPYFSFLIDDGGTGTLMSQLSYSGSKEITFKVVPRMAVDYSDNTRNYKATIFLTAANGVDGTMNKMPFNSGAKQLPNYDEYEIDFYQVTSTEYLNLSSQQ